jgi:hypothetical protein
LRDTAAIPAGNGGWVLLGTIREDLEPHATADHDTSA